MFPQLACAPPTGNTGVQIDVNVCNSGIHLQNSGADRIVGLYALRSALHESVGHRKLQVSVGHPIPCLEAQKRFFTLICVRCEEAEPFPMLLAVGAGAGAARGDADGSGAAANVQYIRAQPCPSTGHGSQKVTLQWLTITVTVGTEAATACD